MRLASISGLRVLGVTNTKWPLGRSTRRTSRSVAVGSFRCSSTHTQTMRSNDSSANGRCSPRPRMIGIPGARCSLSDGVSGSSPMASLTSRQNSSTTPPRPHPRSSTWLDGVMWRRTIASSWSRPDHLDLRFQPGPAGTHLPGVWLLVQPALAPPGPAKVLDGVGDVDAPAVDAGLLQTPLQQLARRAHKGLALKVLLVARLLADQHQPSMFGALAEHRLGRVGPKVAGLARGRRLLQLHDAAGPFRRLRHAQITHELSSNWA